MSLPTIRSARGPALVLLAFAAAGPGAAQDRNVWGFSIPESPAFTFLDASPAEVARPARPRDLAFALANGLDSIGRVQQGIALDVVPWPWVPGLRPDLRRYQDRWWVYAAVNTGISLGTVRSAGDSASTDIAVGLRTVLFDQSDPMSNRSFTSAIGDRTRHCRATPGDTAFLGVHDTLEVVVLRDGGRDTTVRVAIADTVRTLPVRESPRAAERAPCVQAAFEEWRKEWLRKNWNRPSLAVALAMGGTFERSVIGEFRSRGFSAWASGAYPVGKAGQAVGQLRVDRVRSSGDGDRVRIVSAGARGIWGSEKANAFAEVLRGWSSEESTGGDDPGTRWSAGIEFRAAEDLWLSTGFGQRFADTREDETPVFLIANLRWNVSTAPRIGGSTQ